MPLSKTWFKLDNAATVFPGQNTSRWSNIFRFSVVLDCKIDPEILEDALINVLVRFPCYDVRIKRGLFWYYFEKNPYGAPPVEPDVVNPCHRVKFKENKDTTYPYLWDTMKAVLRGKFIALSSSIIKLENSHLSSLKVHLKD